MKAALFAALLGSLLSVVAFAADTPGARQPLAEVDGEAITADEIEKPIAGQIAKLQEQIYNLKRQRLDNAIRS